MLKRPITYTDFNDEEQTETFYFNISETEVIKMETKYEGGYIRVMRNIIEAEDEKRIIEEFQSLILDAYGQRSDDGKRFIKDETTREYFANHAAFNALFMELARDDKKAAEFLLGVFPKKMIEDMDLDAQKIVDQAKEIVGTKGPDGLSG